MIVIDYYNHDNIEISGFCKEYRFLSNFYAIPIWHEGFLYPSVENAYQAMKFDEQNRKQFCSISPSESKKLGKMIKTDKNWDLKKFDVMSGLVFNKFCDNDLKYRLLKTESKQLKETNTWHDVYWGIDYKTGKGENKLGKILMKVREFWK